MRFLVMFVTAVCVLFLIKLRWPKKNNFYVTQTFGELYVAFIPKPTEGNLIAPFPLGQNCPEK